MVDAEEPSAASQQGGGELIADAQALEEFQR